MRPFMVPKQCNDCLEPVFLGTVVVTAAGGQDDGIASPLEIEQHRLSAPSA